MSVAMREQNGNRNDLALVFLMLGILTVLFTPIPPQLLDFLIIVNLSFAMLILLLTFYMGKPVEFSTFPSLLLIATLFRLSLNIAATRLILSHANAGRVIGAIGAFVVGGNFVIGLIVFIILVVVQYVVVTSGAQRVAEVAARFTLDSMPGQQMSIDADLNMGFIDQTEAQRRRRNIEKEASFYGSMDGASKFVKGDAIAGIVILLVDIAGGLAVAVLQLGMSWQDALQTYTLLTVGDGIVTQAPALVIAIGTGIIVTRSGADNRLSAEVMNQITAFPKTLLIVMAALAAFMLLPGMPALQVGMVLALLGVLCAVSLRAKARQSSDASGKAPGTPESESESEDLYEALAVEPVEVRIGSALATLISGEDLALLDRIASLRRQYALESGMVIPKVRFRDDAKLDPSRYEIDFAGVLVASGDIPPGRHLAIHPAPDTRPLAGVPTRDPSYGLPAIWIAEGQRQEARSAGYTVVDPVTVFVTHFSELIRRQASVLLTRVETESLVNRVRQRQPGLVEELIPAMLSLSELQKLLQNLLRENVSVRHMEAILEVLIDGARQSRDIDVLTEAVRRRLGPAICQKLMAGGTDLQVLTFDPAIEQMLAAALRNADQAGMLILEPRQAEQMLTRLAAQVDRMTKSNLTPVLLCAPELRRHIRRLTERLLPHLAILSMAEVPATVSLRAYGTVSL